MRARDHDGGRARHALRGDADDVLSRGHICPKAHGLRELYEDPDRLRTPRIREGERWRDAAGTRRSTSPRRASARFASATGATPSRSTSATRPCTRIARRSARDRADGRARHEEPLRSQLAGLEPAPLRVHAGVRRRAVDPACPTSIAPTTSLMLGANPAASNGSMMALGDRARASRRSASAAARSCSSIRGAPRRRRGATSITSSARAATRRSSSRCSTCSSPRTSSTTTRRARRRGLAALRALAARFPPERVAPAIGIDAATRSATIARELATRSAPCVYGRVGICQNEFGPVATWLVEALNVVTGNFDREGGAMFPTPAADVAPLGAAGRRQPLRALALARARAAGVPRRAAVGGDGRGDGDAGRRADPRARVRRRQPRAARRRTARASRARSRSSTSWSAIDFYLNETTRHAHVLLPPRTSSRRATTTSCSRASRCATSRSTARPIVPPRDDTRDDWDDRVRARAAPSRARRRVLRARAALRVARDLPERAIDLLLRTGPHRAHARASSRARAARHRSRPARAGRDGRACARPTAACASRPTPSSPTCRASSAGSTHARARRARR